MQLRSDPQDPASEFDALYSDAAVRIARQLALMTGDVTEAQEAVQEAFERAWQHWATVRQCESSEAWVRTVARRIAVSRWRRLRTSTLGLHQRREPEPTPPVGPDHVALMTALQALPPAQRVAIVLHHLADLPIAQVAQETGASVAAVKQQLARGRTAMAAHLTEEEPLPRVDNRPAPGGERR